VVGLVADGPVREGRVQGREAPPEGLRGCLRRLIGRVGCERAALTDAERARACAEHESVQVVAADLYELQRYEAVGV
jgi:hypothetical protein